MRNVITRRDWIDSRPWVDRDEASIAAYVGNQEGEKDFDLMNALSDWRERGIVIFPGAVDPALIDAMSEDVEYLKRHYRDFDLVAEAKGQKKPIASFEPGDLESDGVKFNGIHSYSRAAALLSLTPVAMRFLRHVFGSAPCVLQSLTFRKGSQQPAHIDYPYVRCQTKLGHLAASWIPLEDIKPTSGPLAYYPGSHKVEVSDFFDWGGGSILNEADSTRTPGEFAEFLRSRIAIADIKPETFLPRKGDILIWHGNLIHEGTRIQDPSATRKSYVTHYTSEEAYPKSHLSEDRRCLAKGEGYAFEFPWLDKNRMLLPSAN